MKILDILLIIIVGYCFLRGIFRGLIKELAAIVGVLGGLYAAYGYYPLLAKELSRWITNPGYLNILSCLLLFFAVYLVVSLVGVMIKYLMNITFLGWTDRIGGAFFGTVKGGLLAAVLILVLTSFLPRNAPLLRDSLTAPQMILVSAVLVKAASQDMKAIFGVNMKELEKTWRVNKR